MVSRIEKVDYKSMNELREMNDSGGSERHKL